MLTLRLNEGEYVQVGMAFIRAGGDRGQVEVDNALVLLGPYLSDRGKRWLLQVQRVDFRKPLTTVISGPLNDGRPVEFWPADDPRLRKASDDRPH